MFIGEKGYLNLVRKIITQGEIRAGRNGNTLSLFGEQLRMPLINDNQTPILPLLTTKYVPLKLVLEELRWFISGRTDNQWLRERNVKIWDANAEAGPLWSSSPKEDLGPIYGFQWRHFGASYEGHVDKGREYNHMGVDQIEYIFNELKHMPESRRAVMSAWNPVDIPQMTLPPCHVLSQFWIGKNGLSCHLYQRSADMGLGVPFNIASYSLLTHAFAKALNVKPSMLVMSYGDCHIYESHIAGLQEQIEREPMEFPEVIVPEHPHPIDIVMDSMNVREYKHHGRIRLPMVA